MKEYGFGPLVREWLGVQFWDMSIVGCLLESSFSFLLHVFAFLYL
jgi:hypothetical protein